MDSPKACTPIQALTAWNRHRLHHPHYRRHWPARYYWQQVEHLHLLHPADPGPSLLGSVESTPQLPQESESGKPDAVHFGRMSLTS